MGLNQLYSVVLTPSTAIKLPSVFKTCNLPFRSSQRQRPQKIFNSVSIFRLHWPGPYRCQCLQQPAAHVRLGSVNDSVINVITLPEMTPPLPPLTPSPPSTPSTHCQHHCQHHHHQYDYEIPKQSGRTVDRAFCLLCRCFRWRRNRATPRRWSIAWDAIVWICHE